MPDSTLPNALPVRPAVAWGTVVVSLVCAGFQPARAADVRSGAAASPRQAASAAQEAPTDPMDLLRQRLAERLGAQRPTEKGAANNVMRVDNRASGSSAPTARTAANEGSRPTAVAVAAPHAKAPAVGATAPAPAGDAALASAHTISPSHAVPGHWDYAGDSGPDAWARLKPEFDVCATGKRQSPIDIRGGIAVDLEPIQFDYRPSSFSVIDNGHTVQVNVSPGNTISVMGRRFELVQFHFHRPSEERINGKQYDMVAHLVHRDGEGKLAVVAVLLDRGVAQPVIQAVWNALPLEKNESQAGPGTIELAKLLPEDRRYYTYMGSLTTPPCTEGVLWMVMKTPVPVSPAQIDIFAHLYPMNARPLQQVAGRLIKESN